MADPILNHHIIGDDDAESWLYVLHGIYGAGRNWATFGRQILGAKPGWGAVLVDLRLHGHSLDFEPPHSLAACAHDVNLLVEALERPAAAVLGHSFGGKVALMAGAGVSPRQTWVIDSTPSRKTPGGSVTRMLQIIRQLPPTFSERRDAVAALEAEGLATHVAHWMGTNVIPAEGGGYRWRFDFDGIEHLLLDYFRRDLWDVIEDPEPHSELHIVRATESDVIPDAEFDRVRRSTSGRVFGHELAGGHWLHVDNPAGLLQLVGEHLI